VLETLRGLCLPEHALEDEEDGRLFCLIANDSSVMIVGVHPVVRQHPIEVIELAAPRYHDVEIPVVEGQPVRHRERLSPELATGDRSRRAHTILTKHPYELIPFEMSTSMNPVGSLGRHAAAGINECGIPVDKSDLGE